MDIEINPELAAWLEDTLKTILTQNPKCISICAETDEKYMTAYYRSDATDKALMAQHINMDAVMDVVVNNIGLIKKALEDFDDVPGEKEEPE